MAPSAAVDLERTAAMIFDTDGVITDTARVHATAWKRVFDTFLRERAERSGERFRPFDMGEDYLRHVDGKSRTDGVLDFLASRGIAADPGTVAELAARKDASFLAEIHEHGVAPSLRPPNWHASYAVAACVRPPSQPAVTAPRCFARPESPICSTSGSTAWTPPGWDWRENPIRRCSCRRLGNSPSNQARRRWWRTPSRGCKRPGRVASASSSASTGTGTESLCGPPAPISSSPIWPNYTSTGEDVNPWLLTYDGFDPTQEGLREALTTLGNGYFAARGAVPESHADGMHYPGTYVAGCYDRLVSQVAGHSTENEDLVNAPNWLPLTFRADGGDWFAPGSAEILAQRHTLDMRQGFSPGCCASATPGGGSPGWSSTAWSRWTTRTWRP